MYVDIVISNVFNFNKHFFYLFFIFSKYNNNKQSLVIFYKKWKKYNEIQLTKNKMDLNIRKITNYPPSLGTELKQI